MAASREFTEEVGIVCLVHHTALTHVGRSTLKSVKAGLEGAIARQKAGCVRRDVVNLK